MPYNKMTLEELQLERIKLLNQRLVRLRGSNSYKRLSAKIRDVEKQISILLKAKKQKADAELRERIRKMTSGEVN